MLVNAGERSRWANFLAGVFIALTVLLFANLVELIAMPALAGLLAGRQKSPEDQAGVQPIHRDWQIRSCLVKGRRAGFRWCSLYGRPVSVDIDAAHLSLSENPVSWGALVQNIYC